MTQIWPIGGGKGGSGKSFLTSSLGRLLAAFDKKTLLVDLDLGSANLHTMLDVPYPEKCFSDYVQKRVSRLEDIVLETPVPNLYIISGARDSLDIANLPYEQKGRTLKAIAKLDYDWIFLDLGAGTSFNILDFFLISQNSIFITTPEPTSIENVYRLVRAVYFRRIRQYFNVTEFKALEEKVVAQYGEGSFNKPDFIMRVIKTSHPQKGTLLENDFNSFKFKLVLNQLRKQDNIALGPQICKIMEKHLGFHVEFAGNVAFDDRVHDAICQRVSFLERYPYTRTAYDLRELSKNIAQSGNQQMLLRYS
ncbi:MAG TPA: AAA family ATPase [Smithellaceae bacterium]|jgi:flagellar biosynthesis protein FlhG|nr:AAA family ATPase [Smithellaceae bacterium]HNT90437.1 AAA family ATPase [Smithellaceae bacterium]HOD30708.1 AAA family ATPase [Smithellaceae bacterium]HOF76988.1 AAA family ATPase [Smithellaceae bacterium]HOM68614.1 AAA family ATPase [Smithellaceae bacterium]